jgi:2-O-methyltransferase
VATHRGEIKTWVRKTFSWRGNKLFIELGSYDGSDTKWLSEIPDVVIHATEPDLRNTPHRAKNVINHRWAIGDKCGTGEFYLSKELHGKLWTCSSSLRKPKNHLTKYPVSFHETTDRIQVVSLDAFCNMNDIGKIDFQWWDTQGAECDIIKGGSAALARTRYLFTEYSNEELYEGQATLDQLLLMLPNWKILERWPDDVLLENRNWIA